MRGGSFELAPAVSLLMTWVMSTVVAASQRLGFLFQLPEGDGAGAGTQGAACMVGRLELEGKRGGRRSAALDTWWDEAPSSSWEAPNRGRMGPE